MASDFPFTNISTNHDAYDVQYFKPDPAATFAAYVPVVQDTGDQEINEVGADPALILGVAFSTAANKWLYDGRVPVAILTSNFLIGFAVAGTLTAAHVGKTFGITKAASGNWRMDIAKTAGASDRVYCRRVNIDRQIAYATFLAA